MNMVFLDIEFQDFDQVLLLTIQVDVLPGIFSKVTLENLKTIFGTKDNMVFAFIDGV
jgi:hypothetical protein